jgi:hypothetical protein
MKKNHVVLSQHILDRIGTVRTLGTQDKPFHIVIKEMWRVYPSVYSPFPKSKGTEWVVIEPDSAKHFRYLADARAYINANFENVRCYDAHVRAFRLRQRIAVGLTIRYGTDPIVRKMLERSYPLTGEQYLALAYGPDMPEDIDHLPSEIHDDIPRPLREHMR